MKKTVTVTYTSDDGTKFQSESDCVEYEKSISIENFIKENYLAKSLHTGKLSPEAAKRMASFFVDNFEKFCSILHTEQTEVKVAFGSFAADDMVVVSENGFSWTKSSFRFVGISFGKYVVCANNGSYVAWKYAKKFQK